MSLAHKEKKKNPSCSFNDGDAHPYMRTGNGAVQVSAKRLATFKHERRTLPLPLS